jgi:hypothetical protein
VVRNFYAHRNDQTARAAKEIARHYTIAGLDHPTQILSTPAYGRPQVLILDWIDELTIIVEFLCE